ncbi:hypothetical protein LZ495_42225 [Yinghuangia sp. KLBMP8922]|uniref:WD40 repeat domain-containing protein n=2 Tax=Yinghuangia soli TaxID=2908204 RepID=A0AA41U5B7_9ACTN|nr:hypothetical protein [Yinghuangia soli]MCF2533805.1 hypothetical protein [Yinghuangia soli]
MAAFTNDPDRLVSAAAGGTVRLWSLTGQHQVAEVRIDASLHCAAFDADSGRVLAASALGVTALQVVGRPEPGEGAAEHGRGTTPTP